MKVLIIIISVILVNCTSLPQFVVYVNSISDAKGEVNIGTKYWLTSSMKNLNTNDLQYQEYSAFIHKALISRGYIQSSSMAHSDIIIFLQYGISEPKTNQSAGYKPIWGQKGISSSTTSGSINSFGGTSTYSGSTIYNSSYGVTGYKPYTRTHTTYTRYIILEAINSKIYLKNKKILQVWKTTIMSSGSSGDIRRVFPVLVAAANAYIGGNTLNNIKIKLTEEDERVLNIKDQ